MDNLDIDDRAAITDLVARFDDDVNRRDLREFQELWTVDAIWAIGDLMSLYVRGRCVETGVFKAQGEKPPTGYGNRALY